MNILNCNPFCLYKGRVLGIALDDNMASSMWRLGDEEYNQVSTRKFSFMSTNGGVYTDDKSCFTRPTKEEIEMHMTANIKAYAIKNGLIEVTTKRNESVSRIYGS